MSKSYVQKANCDELFKLQKEVCNELIHKKQKEYDTSLYSNKHKKDKLDCQICGGKYTRQKKTIHSRSIKHRKKIKQINEKLEKLFD